MPKGVYLRTAEMRTGLSAGSHGNNVRHGHACGGVLSPTYISWRAMVQRCTYPKNNRYANYGGRGIQVCAEWVFFENFLRDMGERPIGTSLDRRDNDGNYEPSNCRWSTPKEQSNNRRSRIRHRKV